MWDIHEFMRSLSLIEWNLFFSWLRVVTLSFPDLRIQLLNPHAVCSLDVRQKRETIEYPSKMTSLIDVK